MIEWHSKFEQIIKDEFTEEEPVKFFNLVREKTFIMLFYEILYRRLPIEMIKETVHKRIYGQESGQLNTLTKFLIDHASKGKREPIKNFASVCTD